MAQNNVLVDYDVVSQFAGHQKNRQVAVVEAAQDIFTKVKNNAMQCACNGSFITFDNVDELVSKLSSAVQEGVSIRIYDENIGG